jgi:hypothetical protein
MEKKTAKQIKREIKTAKRQVKALKGKPNPAFRGPTSYCQASIMERISLKKHSKKGTQ